MNLDIKIISNFIFKNYDEIIKIINLNMIYKKLINYWENFIIYQLEEITKNFLSFYSLPLRI